MAPGGRVEIDPDDLQNGDGTLRLAMKLWCAKHGPVQYNAWQLVFFALMRDHGYVDLEAPEGES